MQRFAGILLFLALGAAAVAATAARPEQTVPKPKPVPRPDPSAIDAALRRGVQFLLDRQNRNGSWGSARNTKGLNIYAPVPGAHHAFRAAVTALCISALCELERDYSKATPALDRAETWLIYHLPKVRRATPRAIYNVWAHAYGIKALVQLIARHGGEREAAKRLKGLIAHQIGMLGRYECVNGGWGYYDFAAHTQKPSGRPNSFVSATVLVALHEAKSAGVNAPPALVERALAALLRQRKPDGSFLYSEPWKWRPQYPINRPAGSLGRSQACNAALRVWGHEETTDAVIAAWLDRLAARNEWLGMGRKRPVPHESWFQVAGYFFYYGHYYAGLCIELLPPDKRAPHQDQLAHILLRLQEKDGSWWDYPLYDYHQQYGTAYALMSLRRCRREP